MAAYVDAATHASCSLWRANPGCILLQCPKPSDGAPLSTAFHRTRSRSATSVWIPSDSAPVVCRSLNGRAGYCCRTVSGKKGVTYLIEAFARVAQKIPDAELVVVGDGPLRAQLEEQARAVNARIDFLGALPSDKVKEQMDKARVFSSS